MPEQSPPTGERKRVALLGSTGSIGRQALDVLQALPQHFEVVGLAAGQNVAALAAQLERHHPRRVGLAAEAPAQSLELPAGSSLLVGSAALEEMATADDVDIVLVATGGIVSLAPVLAALAAGKVVATANKETLVCGGHLVMPLARDLAARHGRAGSASAALEFLRPIDSEHSAIWQCLAGEQASHLKRLVLTASGGPFRDWPADRLAAATPADALAHPTWRMGAKITIDSATLVNKGLEVIEAHWLYDVPYDRIDVVIHPQSIIHSLVEFVDSSLKAQLGLPDMRIPIQYALTYPSRLPSPAPNLAAVDIPELTFEAPDEQRFPALALARRAGQAGPRASAALIAADEVAVARYLDGTLDFRGITALCEEAVAHFGDTVHEDPALHELLDLDIEVRAWAATFRRPGTSGRQ